MQAYKHTPYNDTQRYYQMCMLTHTPLLGRTLAPQLLQQGQTALCTPETSQDVALFVCSCQPCLICHFVCSCLELRPMQRVTGWTGR